MRVFSKVNIRHVTHNSHYHIVEGQSKYIKIQCENYGKKDLLSHYKAVKPFLIQLEALALQKLTTIMLHEMILYP